jgi:hypothetical protein
VYDTRVVYGNWWWPEYPPVYWNYPSSYTYVSGFYWGTSIYLGPTYFYSSCQWRDRHVVVIDRRNHYDGNARFYTGRSIVHYEGAREWHHDPIHRHGVAYYNNNLRETYGSRRESYQDDRVYREQHRDNRVDPRTAVWKNDQDNNRKHDNDRRTQDVNSNDHNINNGNINRDANAPRHFDRAEQVRERLGRDNNSVPSTTNNPHNLQSEPQVNSSHNSPSFTSPEETGRNRAIMTQRTQAEGSIDVNNNRITQDRRAVSDNLEHRPNFSVPVERTQDQRPTTSAAQPTLDHREEAPKRAEFSPPRNEAEGRAQQQQRTERQNNNPRFSREKKDDDNK